MPPLHKLWGISQTEVLWDCWGGEKIKMVHLKEFFFVTFKSYKTPQSFWSRELKNKAQLVQLNCVSVPFGHTWGTEILDHID